MEQSIEEKGKIVHQYKVVQSALRRLIVGSFPDTTIKYLADNALIRSEDRSDEYKFYVRKHYTYLTIISALRQKYHDLYGSDRPHAVALNIFKNLAVDARQFHDSVFGDKHKIEVCDEPEDIVEEECIPLKPLNVTKSRVTKNRKKRFKKMIESEEELFADAMRINKELAVVYSDRKTCMERSCASIGTTKEFIQKIIYVCLRNFDQESFRRKWTDAKHSIFVRGLLAYVHLHFSFKDAEERDPGRINRILFEYLMPFYETFKKVVHSCKKEPVYTDKYPEIYTKSYPDVRVRVWYREGYFKFGIPSYMLAVSGLLQAAFVLGAKIEMSTFSMDHRQIGLHFQRNPIYYKDGKYIDNSIYGRVGGVFNNTSSKNLNCDLCKRDTLYPDGICFYCNIAPVWIDLKDSAPCPMMIVVLNMILKETSIENWW